MCDLLIFLHKDIPTPSTPLPGCSPPQGTLRWMDCARAIPTPPTPLPRCSYPGLTLTSTPPLFLSRENFDGWICRVRVCRWRGCCSLSVCVCVCVSPVDLFTQGHPHPTHPTPPLIFFLGKTSTDGSHKVGATQKLRRRVACLQPRGCVGRPSSRGCSLWSMCGATAHDESSSIYLYRVRSAEVLGVFSTAGLRRKAKNSRGCSLCAAQQHHK